LANIFTSAYLAALVHLRSVELSTSSREMRWEMRAKWSFGFHGDCLNPHKTAQPILLEFQFCQIRVCDALALSIKDADVSEMQRSLYPGQ